VAAIYLTGSGTTGEYKIFSMSQQAIVWRSARMVESEAAPPDYTVLMPVSVEHPPAKTKRLNTFYLGFTSAFQPGPGSRIALPELCASLHVTCIDMGVLHAESAVRETSREEGFPTDTTVYVSGSRVSAQLRRAFEKRFGRKLHVHYGAREFGRISTTWLGDADDALESVGAPAPWVELEIVDGEGKALATGDVGELRVRPQLYNLDCVAYESVLLGLFTIWQGDPGDRPKLNNVFVGFSRDGFHWTRGASRPLLGVSDRRGAWNFGNVQSAGGCCLIVDDRLSYGRHVRVLDGGRLVIGSDTLRRQPAPGSEIVAVSRAKPPAASAEFASLVGEYGWDHDVLYIREKDGQLNALIEWFFEYPLERVSRNVYAFPKSGLYDGQQIVFERGRDGLATVAVAGTVRFKRRPLPADDDRVNFKITPVRPVAELRREALAASPPRESPNLRKPDLVELRSLDPSIKYDIRYATSNNFMGTPFYSSAHAFMQRPAAEAVARASAELRKLGYGLLIHDSYRPWYVTKMFWDGTPPDKHMFVADPAQGSRHNRGAAVDLTLYDLKTGAPIRMTGGYDEMSDRSYPLYPGATSLQRWHRDVLRTAMEAQGFNVIDTEWWHFDYKDWRSYPIGTLTFEQLGASRP